MATTHEAKPILEAVMAERGWDAADLSYRAKVPIDTLRKWLGGTSNPPVKRLAATLAAIGEDPTAHGLPAVEHSDPVVEQIAETLTTLAARVADIPEIVDRLATIGDQLARIEARLPKETS